MEVIRAPVWRESQRAAQLKCGEEEMKKKQQTKKWMRQSTRVTMWAMPSLSLELLLVSAGMLVLLTDLNYLAWAQNGPSGTWSDAQFDDTLIRNSVGNLFRLIEGAFGALIMVVSGIGAIVAAAMGAYRAAVGMIVVAVGSFILRALVSLFFGSEFQDYEV